MIAVSYVEVKGKTFGPGETVKGLSKADEAWMKEKGFIKDEPKAGAKKESANEL